MEKVFSLVCAFHRDFTRENNTFWTGIREMNHENNVDYKRSDRICKIIL